MKIFIYKCIIVFIGIYLTYNFTIGKKIDQYESKLVYIATDHGREQIRDLKEKKSKILWTTKIYLILKIKFY